MHNTQPPQPSSHHARKMVVVVITLVVAMVALVVGGSLLVSKMREGSEQETVATAPAAKTVAAALAPDPAAAENREWTGSMDFNGAKLGVRLFGDKAPKAVASFLYLAETKFLVDTSCHRLTTGGFDILQCGDPTGTGTGGPGYAFGPVENAPGDNLYKRGTLAMARSSSPDSHGSQFFLVYGDTTIGRDAAGGYTVFGEITSGLDAVEKVAAQGTANGRQDGPPAAPAVVGAMGFE